MFSCRFGTATAIVLRAYAIRAPVCPTGSLVDGWVKIMWPWAALGDLYHGKNFRAGLGGPKDVCMYAFGWAGRPFLMVFS